MAVISNQAQLQYGAQTLLSNVALGELLDPLSVTKSTLQSTYSDGDHVNYVISIQNSGNNAFNGMTVTDNLGAYTFGTNTVYPLTYVPNTLNMYVNGTLTTAGAPTVTPGPPLTLTNVNIPANSNVLFVFEADTNGFTPLGTGTNLTNTATLNGPGLATPVSASVASAFDGAPRLGIVKTIDPVPVTAGDPVTYTFTLQNFGATATDPATNPVLTDTFNPVLTNISATLNGAAWPASNYTYDTGTGLFTTTGTISVPPATFTQDPTSGAYSVVPGTTVLTVTGTV